MAEFLDPLTGLPTLVTLTDDGAVPVSDEDGGDDAQDEVVRLLTEILDEQRATRLALQEMLTAGTTDGVDFLALARSIRYGNEN